MPGFHNKRQEQPSPRKNKLSQSLFDKMREATIRPKNYETFHTECDSASYQGGAIKKSSWTSDWMNSTSVSKSKSGAHMDPASTLPVQQEKNSMNNGKDLERRLRKENDLLKVRLNAANNAIRDMENAQRINRTSNSNHNSNKSSSNTNTSKDKHKKKKSQKQNQKQSLSLSHVTAPTSSVSSFSSPSPLVSFLLKKSKRMKQATNDSDDAESSCSISAACASEASTVQMGSLSKNKSKPSSKRKKRRSRKSSSNSRTQRSDSEKDSKSKPSSCSKTLLLGSKLRKKLAQREATRKHEREITRREREREQMERHTAPTPPCTPERKQSYSDSDSSSDAATPMPVTDILKDISKSILGIGTFPSASDEPPLSKETREKKLLSLSRLSTTGHAHDSKDHGHQNGYISNYGYEHDYEAGSYPIDLYHANPISDDYNYSYEYSEDDEYLSTIHENDTATCESDDEYRVEI